MKSCFSLLLKGKGAGGLKVVEVVCECFGYGGVVGEGLGLNCVMGEGLDHVGVVSLMKRVYINNSL